MRRAVHAPSKVRARCAAGAWPRGIRVWSCAQSAACFGGVGEWYALRHGLGKEQKKVSWCEKRSGE
eukprot:2502403-Pleurochrysis_carterae.AAC.1